MVFQTLVPHHVLTSSLISLFLSSRSNDASYADFDVLNVLRWIQVLQEMYSDFDYNDLECQKKIICEVMKEPEYFGSAAQKFKTGFR